MSEVFRADGTLVDTVDKYYKTPLMSACQNANYDVAEFLLDHKFVFYSFKVYNVHCTLYNVQCTLYIV